MCCAEEAPAEALLPPLHGPKDSSGVTMADLGATVPVTMADLGANVPVAGLGASPGGPGPDGANLPR